MTGYKECGAATYAPANVRSGPFEPVVDRPEEAFDLSVCNSPTTSGERRLCADAQGGKDARWPNSTPGSWQTVSRVHRAVQLVRTHTPMLLP
jgi:hypothetical protein